MKTKFYLLMGVTALVCLTGCKREYKASDNPTYNPNTNTVNTQFVLNISTGTGNPDTKQSAVDVQAGGLNFRGITDAHILTYKLGYQGVDNARYLYKVSDNSSKAERDYDLKDLATTSDIITSGDNKNNTRIIELALPLGTNAILLYGRAPTTGTADQQGSVDYGGTALNSSLDNVSFKLNPRLTDKTAFQQYAKLMSGMLTYIMNAGRYVETAANGNKVMNETQNDNSYGFWWPIDDSSKDFALTDAENDHPGYKLYSGSKKWKNYGDAYASNATSLKPLEEVLGEAYHEVMTLQGTSPKTELRAGASVSVLRMVSDMYSVVMRVIKATPTTPEEYIAQLVAQDALARAGAFFHYDETSSTMIYRDLSDIKTGVNNHILNLSAGDISSVNSNFFYYTGKDENGDSFVNPGFPKNLNLPVGAAIMTFKTEGEGEDEYIAVEYPMDIPAYGMGGKAFNIEDYRYPAEITYYVNSPIRTSDIAVEKKSFPTSITGWFDEDSWKTTVWNGKEVTSSTRSVAVEKTINYGTALLKAQFAYSAGTIEDNNKGVHPGEQNNPINVTGEEKPMFYVTGIVIGGIDDTVGWDFLPKGGSFNKMVYDNLDGGSIAIPPYTTNPDKQFSDPIYTCTWDNYNSTLNATEQSEVYIGLELVNNTGDDIWGELNMIRDGGTFYLVGKLDPQEEGAAKNFVKGEKVDLSRTDCFYPPFNENGATINAPRVFMQDYVTNVKFLFSPTSLKHAYVTMPDLRAGQVSLGLSVDLTWEPGMEFTVDLGDNTSTTE